MGGRGGMGGMMSGGTMPASMGMMMLGRLIMNLIGDRDSWNQRSLMMGMMMGGMGGMGGGMMGGMGGGMGGMGGMGGGFRSVPPTGPMFTTLEPRQSRHLPTSVVSLNPPDANGQPVAPGANGEPVSDSEHRPGDRTTHALERAIKRLAEEKTPQTIAQMVLWYVTAGRELGRHWPAFTRLGQRV